MLDLSEAQSYTAIAPDEVWSVSYRALVRLLLFFTGRTHDQLADFSREAEGILTAAGGAGGQLDGLGLYHAVSGVTAAWNQTFKAWNQEFETLRLEAAAIPLGSLCVLHENLVRPWLASIEEGRTPIGRELTEAAAASTTFDQPIDAVIKAANQRVYEDGLQLSQRVWRLDHDALNGIKQVIYNGAANGRSAWDMAKDLEQYLGFSQGCPRWTSTRLRLTKKEIAAGDIRGLKSGEACQGQGVAYKALRLARNELQVIHALATDQMMAALPFVEKEQIFLSPSHPEDDECDQVIRDGENGRGIYPKGTITIPIHVHCVTPSQLVETLRGVIRIEDVMPGDHVLTHQDRYRPVTKTWAREYAGSVYLIRTEHGTLQITSEHPVLLRRGWVDAQFVQPGEEIVYALSSVLTDRATGIAENMPATFPEPGVAPRIMAGVHGVPPAPVAFNIDFVLNDRKVNEVTPDVVLTGIDDAGLIERIHEDTFGLARGGDASLSISDQHGHQTGVALTLSAGDLAPDARFLAGGNLASLEPSEIAFLKTRPNVGAAREVSLPCGGDRLAHSAQRNITQRQEAAQQPVGETVTREYFRGPQLLGDIDVEQEIFDRGVVLSFDTELVKLNDSQPMRLRVGLDDSLHLPATNGASDRHDNLLLLSPEIGWGAGSGNPVVGEVASPAQALPHYSTVLNVTQKEYVGPVYNLSVLDDNTYTVNGAVVHNCLCNKVAVMPKGPDGKTVSPDEFTDQLRGWVNGTQPWPAMDQYAGLVGGDVTAGLGGASVLASLLLWAWGDADQMKAVLP